MSLAFGEENDPLEATGRIFTVMTGSKKKKQGKENQISIGEEENEMQHPESGFKLDGHQPQDQQQRMSPTMAPMNFPQASYDTPTTARQFLPPGQMPFDFGAIPNLTPQMDPQMNWNQLALAQACMMPFHFTPPWASTPASLQSTPGSNDSGLSLQDSSPEASNCHDNEEIYKVQARLSLNNNSRQYSVSRAEIARRLQHPECMNSSTLASLFRRAKVQGGGEVMRKELQKKGLDLAPENRRRKHAETTCFSALTEEESVNMAQELHKLVQSHYPMNQMVETIISSTRMEDLRELAMEAHYAARFMARMKSVADQTKVSVAKISHPPISDPLHNQMRTFSALTHGFGLVDQKTWMEAFAQIGDLTSGVANARAAGHHPM